MGMDLEALKKPDGVLEFEFRGMEYQVTPQDADAQKLIVRVKCRPKKSLLTDETFLWKQIPPKDTPFEVGQFVRFALSLATRRSLHDPVSVREAIDRNLDRRFVDGSPKM